MQLLLLAISIILLTLFAGKERGTTGDERKALFIKMEKPKVDDIEKDDIPADNPSVYFSRFDLFVN